MTFHGTDEISEFNIKITLLLDHHYRSKKKIHFRWDDKRGHRNCCVAEGAAYCYANSINSLHDRDPDTRENNFWISERLACLFLWWLTNEDESIGVTFRFYSARPAFGLFGKMGPWSIGVRAPGKVTERRRLRRVSSAERRRSHFMNGKHQAYIPPS